MNPSRLPVASLALSLLLSACTSHAVPDEAAPHLAALRACESMEIFAIDPNSGYDGLIEGPDRLQGCRVLGRTSVTSTDDRARIARLVADGVARSDGSLAHCFLPRHGVRVHAADGIHDFVACYQCLTLRVLAPGATEFVTLPTSNGVEPELTALFERLGLQIPGDE